ncbi:MAG TPA: phage tail protein [Kofleriaceae bacterium]|nr:phage tail protein [Kofleriaceae bacterium]
MANPGNRRDPLPVFCFAVNIDGLGTAFFKSVSGIKYETESIPVREGGANDTTFMLVGATKWSPIVLKNGFTASSILLEWRQSWLKPGALRRYSGVITQFDTTGKTKKAEWKFFNGWPTKWEISEFDASKSELAIETLEITHEGIEFTKVG